MELLTKGFETAINNLRKAAKQIADVEAELESEVSYAPMVGFKKTQLPIHQGRWNTIEELKLKYEKTYSQRLGLAIRKFFKEKKFNQNPLMSVSEDILENIREELILYPPKLPNQKYKRTLRYKNSWRIRFK